MLLIPTGMGTMHSNRIASNNLNIGGEALIKAGLDHESPVDIAKSSRATQFFIMLQRNGFKRLK